MAGASTVTKGTKRVSVSTAAAPAKKTKAKNGRPVKQAEMAPEKKIEKVDPNCRGILEAVDQATVLPEHVRKMLTACIPKAFETPCDQRHASQTAMVKMVGVVIDDVLAKLQALADVELEKVSSVLARKAELDAAVAEAEQLFAECTMAEEASNVRLTELTAAEETAKAAKSESEAAQLAGDEDIVKVRKEKAELEAVMSGCFAVIVEGELDDASQQYQELLPFVQGMGMDDSLMSALPSSCNKKASARGDFDKMVLDQIGVGFKAKLAVLTEAVETASPAAEERAAAVSAAQAGLDAAVAAREVAAKDLLVAGQTTSDSREALSLTKDAVSRYATEFSEATKARDATALELENFRVYNVGSFELLRDKASPAIAEASPAIDEASLAIVDV